MQIFLILATLLGGGRVAARDMAVVGTGDGLEILRSVSAAFSTANPGHSVNVPASIGSGGAIAAVGSDREILGRVARPLTTTEQASGLVYHPVLRIPVAFYVHPELKTRSLTSEQLRSIFAGTVLSWSDVGGEAVRIRVVRREEADSSTAVLRATMPVFSDLKFTERSKLAQTTQDAVDSIRDNSGAIGFAPYSAILAAQLGVVAVDGKAPDHPDYASAVILALIYKSERLDETARRYIGFFATEEAKQLISRFGARPLSR